MLDGGSDINTLGTSGDFYTISQGGHGTVGPARTAVLRNVLVSGDSAVVHTVLVAPGEVSWVGLNSQKVFVGASACAVSFPDNASGLNFLLGKEFVATGKGSGEKAESD